MWINKDRILMNRDEIGMEGKKMGKKRKFRKTDRWKKLFESLHYAN